MDSVQEDNMQENNKTTKKQQERVQDRGCSARVHCERNQRASSGRQHASGVSGPVRISVAYGNVPAPGL